MDDPGFDIYYNYFMKPTLRKKGRKSCVSMLSLILLFSVIIVGGERGAISLIAHSKSPAS